MSPTPSTLKRLRNACGLTQATVAKRVGVSQPNYQRWESGAAPVPADKLRKLAKALRTSIEAVQGNAPYAQVSSAYVDDEGQHAYWGEIAIHFTSGAPPIVASISAAECKRLYPALQARDKAFVEVRGLCNEHYVVRRAAILDVYLSHEASDYPGAADTDYPDFVAVHIVDPRLWDVLVAYEEELEPDLFDFEPEDAYEALSHFMTRSQIAEWLGIEDRTGSTATPETPAHLGHAHPATEIAESRDQVTERCEAFLVTRASATTVRYSNGVQRAFRLREREDFTENLANLTSLASDSSCMLVLSNKDDAQDVFVASLALDYVRFPAHYLDRALDGCDPVVHRSDSDDDS